MFQDNMNAKLLILLFFTLSLPMNSQDNNTKEAIIYMNNGVYVIYYSDKNEFLYLNNGKQNWYKNFEVLKESLAKNEGIELKPNLKDYFDYQLTNYNLFIGQDHSNIDELYGKVIQNFEKKYSISISSKDDINKLFRKKIKSYNDDELKDFLAESEIFLLLYSGNYLIKNNRSNFRLHWNTVTEKNIFNEEFLMKSLYFNEKEFNLLKNIRYYFNELLNRHKYLKKNTEFDIDTMINFIEINILNNISSSYPINELSENYKKNMITD